MDNRKIDNIWSMALGVSICNIPLRKGHRTLNARRSP
jgi:hypothetical protein